MESESINLTLKQYQDYLKSDDFIGSGLNSRIFLYQEKSVLKLWKEYVNIAVLNLFRQNITALLLVRNNALITPQKLVKLEDKIVGYTMPYFSGCNLSELPLDTSLTKLYEALVELEKNIKEIAKMHLDIGDIHSDNIMYNQGKFVFLDCDLWSFSNYDNDKYFQQEILKGFNSAFIRDFYPGDNQDDYELFIWGNPVLSKLLADKNFNFNPSCFLETLVTELEKYYQEDILTMKDIQRVLKM